jgi:hypothetical protein
MISVKIALKKYVSVPYKFYIASSLLLQELKEIMQPRQTIKFALNRSVKKGILVE